MKKSPILAFLLGFSLTLAVNTFAAPIWNIFSPGGALSGTWNSQNVNVGAGAPFITGTLPAGNGGNPGAANPTASVGLTAVNGTATTFTRSDGAPSLSQSISPTWTGTHTFTTNGVVVGSPTGGNEGAGSINATSFFINGQPNYRICAFKVNSTARSSTTTLTADPDLQVTIPVAGTYRIELLFEFNGTTTGTQGLKWNFSGTATVSASGMMAANGFVNNAALTISEISGMGTVIALPTIDTGAPNDWIKIDGVYNGIVAGTWIFNWAQNTSSANATNILGQDFLCFTRLQ